jgi:bla regulator protein BlaR1
MSLKGSILILLILLIKTVFRDRLNTKFHYCIWFILIIKLIVPYGLESSFSVFNLFNPIMEKKIVYENDNIKTTKSLSSIDIGPNLDKIVYIKSYHNKNDLVLSKKINYEKILLYMWLLGTIVLTISTVLGIRKIKIINKTAVSIGMPKFNCILSNYIRMMNISEKVLLKYTDKIDSPCLYGIIKPVIFIPINTMENISEDEFKYIIVHELSHLKRKDILIKWITIILSIVYWFNPIIRYGFCKMSEDCEVSCDADALNYLNYNENIDYGNAIIRVLELGNKAGTLIGTTSMVINKSEIKRRIIMISKYKKVSMKSVLCGFLVVIAAGSVGLTNNICKAKDIFEFNSFNDYKGLIDSWYMPDNNDRVFHDTKDFEMKEIDFKGYEQFYSDILNKNIFSVEFEIFDATELYQIKSSKQDYSMKISSNIKSGTVTIKVYDGEKVLFEKDNPVNETIMIPNKLDANIRLECIGKKANGNFKIELSQSNYKA